MYIVYVQLIENNWNCNLSFGQISIIMKGVEIVSQLWDCKKYPKQKISSIWSIWADILNGLQMDLVIWYLQ